MGACSKATWRGVTVCAHMVADLDQLAQDVGSIYLKPFLNPPSGSYQTTTTASLGTHAGGGAIDFDMSSYWASQARTVETACRKRLKLAYYRAPVSGLWQRHVHVTFPECPNLSDAACAQYPLYQQGLDNLADNGPDTGVRTYVAATMDVFNNRLNAPAYDVLPPALTTGADMPLSQSDLDAIGALIDKKLAALLNNPAFAEAVWTAHNIVKDTRNGQEATAPRVTPSTLLEDAVAHRAALATLGYKNTAVAGIKDANGNPRDVYQLVVDTAVNTTPKA